MILCVQHLHLEASRKWISLTWLCVGARGVAQRHTLPRRVLRRFWGRVLRRVADPGQHLQESLGPSGPKSPKTSQKGSFRLSAKKSLGKSKHAPNSPISDFRPFLEFLVCFRGLRSDPPKRPFLRPFCDLGPKGPETRVNGGSGRNRRPVSASSKPTTEFAQPHLSRVKRRSSPPRGYKFGRVFVPKWPVITPASS